MPGFQSFPYEPQGKSDDKFYETPSTPLHSALSPVAPASFVLAASPAGMVGGHVLLEARFVDASSSLRPPKDIHLMDALHFVRDILQNMRLLPGHQVAGSPSGTMKGINPVYTLQDCSRGMRCVYFHLIPACEALIYLHC